MSLKTNLGLLYSHTDPNTLLHLGMDKANAFNTYLCSVFTLDYVTLCNFLLRIGNDMASFTTSLEEVCNVLKVIRVF